MSEPRLRGIRRQIAAGNEWYTTSHNHFFGIKETFLFESWKLVVILCHKGINHKMMRREALFVVAFCALTLAWTAGCTDKAPVETDTLAVDTFVIDTVPVDTMEELISERVMPKSADELFDDFIFNFAANKRLQFKRIVFPLPVKDGEITTNVEQDEWEMERFFMHQGYYTLILDNRLQTEITKDTSVNNAVIEKIDLRNRLVKTYNFDRTDGQWMLTFMEYQPLENNVNASFLDFYDRFTTDSTVFFSSLHDPIHFTGPDLDDENSEMSEDISPDRWEDLGLDEMPSGLIYNIIYGQTYTRQDQKVLIMRGIANGLEAELTFRCIDGMWMLVRVVV